MQCINDVSRLLQYIQCLSAILITSQFIQEFCAKNHYLDFLNALRSVANRWLPVTLNANELMLLLLDGSALGRRTISCIWPAW